MHGLIPVACPSAVGADPEAIAYDPALRIFGPLAYPVCTAQNANMLVGQLSERQPLAPWISMTHVVDHADQQGNERTQAHGGEHIRRPVDTEDETGDGDQACSQHRKHHRQAPGPGQIRATHNAAPVANAAVLRVCPLGKLEPQYHCVPQRRPRPTNDGLHAPDDERCRDHRCPMSTASKRRRATRSAMAVTTATGTSNLADPLNVTKAVQHRRHLVSNEPQDDLVNRPGLFRDHIFDQFDSTTASVSTPKTAKRRFVRCSVHCGLRRRA